MRFRYYAIKDKITNCIEAKREMMDTVEVHPSTTSFLKRLRIIEYSENRHARVEPDSPRRDIIRSGDVELNTISLKVDLTALVTVLLSVLFREVYCSSA